MKLFELVIFIMNNNLPSTLLLNFDPKFNNQQLMQIKQKTFEKIEKLIGMFFWFEPATNCRLRYIREMAIVFFLFGIAVRPYIS